MHINEAELVPPYVIQDDDFGDFDGFPQPLNQDDQSARLQQDLDAANLSLAAMTAERDNLELTRRDLLIQEQRTAVDQAEILTGLRSQLAELRDAFEKAEDNNSRLERSKLQAEDEVEGFQQKSAEVIRICQELSRRTQLGWRTQSGWRTQVIGILKRNDDKLINKNQLIKS